MVGLTLVQIDKQKNKWEVGEREAEGAEEKTERGKR